MKHNRESKWMQLQLFRKIFNLKMFRFLLKAVVVAVIGVGYFPTSHTHPDPIQYIENRLNGFNATLVVAQHQITTIKLEIRAVTSTIQFDIGNLFAKFLMLNETIQKTWTAVESLQEQTASLTTSIEGVQSDVTGLSDRVQALEESNKLWQRNFQIVNKTFAMLRNTRCLSPL